MYERMYEFAAYMWGFWPGALVGTIVITIVHFTLWDFEIPRVPSYVIGTLCVISGMIVTTFLTGNPYPFLEYFAHLAPCGAAIALLWAWRGEQKRREKAAIDAKEIQEIAERERTG